MTRARTHSRRAAFTLVELLVGISIFLALAGLVLLLYPGARDQDRVRYAVSDVTAHLRIAQSMAMRDKAPRGLRFIVNPGVSATTPDPTNDLKIDPRWVTELQYVEQPLPLIPNRSPLSNSSNTYNPATDPRVRFEYTVSTGGAGAPAAGTITGRACVIENLSTDQQSLIQSGCTLVLPVLGFWSKITGPGTASGSRLTVPLEVYPDAILGGSTYAQTYHFAIYLTPTPLVGEPVLSLPKNICVDLNVSPPASGTSDFDILFGPDGKLVGSFNGATSVAGGQLFLWVRDFSKPAPYAGTGAGKTDLTNTTTPTLTQALQRGGEQMIIAVRASGAIGYNNVAWPDPATGQWSQGEPFKLARQEIR